MTAEIVASPARTKPPLHLWIVGGLSLLWNAFGALDYTLTQFNVEAYLNQFAFTPEQMAYLDSFPAWAVAGWALGVWGSLLGSIGLLMRRKWAVGAFAVSLLGLIVSSIYSVGLSDGMTMMGDSALVTTIFIWVVLIALLLYARSQAAKGVLR